MTRLIQTCCVAILLSIMQLAQGAQRVDPYQARVILDNQQGRSIAEAYQQALLQVLVNLSGDESAVMRTDLLNALPDARSLSSSRGFLSADSARKFGFSLQPDQQIMEITFFERNINNLMQQLGLPLWQLERPETLLWIARRNRFNTEFLDQEGDRYNRQLISNLSERFAIPLQVPLYDLDDLRQVSADNIVNNDLSVIEQTSLRYDTEQLMLMSVTENATHWTVDVTLLGLSTPMNWRSHGETTETAIAAAINQLSDRMGAQLSVSQTAVSGRPVRLEVSDIRNAAEYHQLMSYLDELIVIDGIEVVEASPDRILLYLQTTTGDTGLSRIFASSELIEPAVFDSNINISRDLHYTIRRLPTD